MTDYRAGLDGSNFTAINTNTPGRNLVALDAPAANLDCGRSDRYRRQYNRTVRPSQKNRVVKMQCKPFSPHPHLQAL